jgi:predicted RND superfamily exporter protein
MSPGPAPADPVPAPPGRLEALLFGHRRAVVAVAAALTAALGAVAATRTVVSAGFEDLRPAGHPWVRAYAAHRDRLRGLGDAVLVAVESRRGEVWDPAYLEALREITDDLFLAPGVDRPFVKSLWTPNVRWIEVTEEGFRGGPVMPDAWDGSAASVAALRRSVARAGLAGSLVAEDERSTLVFVPLLDHDPLSGAPPDPRALAARVEALRARHEARGVVAVHAVGFAVLVGALIQGIRQVAAWFAVAAAVVTLALFAYTRCLRSTALVVGCAVVALVWQMGIAAALGLALDPFSVLVPFLLFAGGVSHGAQRMNGVLVDVARGERPEAAARLAFRRLLAAGVTALLTDAVGFAVLALVDVPAVRRLALVATLGVAALVFTSLVLLPVLLSFTGVSPAAAARALRAAAPEEAGAPAPRIWRLLAALAEPRPAAVALALAAAVTAAAAVAGGRALTLGTAGPGASELAPGARYNRDAAFVARRFGVTSHPFAVLVRTPPEGCAAFATLDLVDRLGWALRQVPGVRGTTSLADAVRRITADSFEGNPRWLTLPRDQRLLDAAAEQAVTRNPDLFDPDCSLVPVVAQLEDHDAPTLARVAAAASALAAAHGAPGREVILAAGAGAFEAATNEVVARATPAMAALVYLAVVLLCRAALGSWRAVAVAVAPIAVTSVLCGALMARLGIGVRLSTLPVIALGVGIPDYGLYLLSVQLAHRRAGADLALAHRRALRFTGRVVALVSVVLAAGVITWTASPIALQADMGILLAFMFLGNAASALVLVPALSRVLLPPATRLAAGPLAGEAP